MNNPGIKKIIVFVSALILLTSCFYANPFKVAHEEWFEHFADGAEALFIARLAKSRQDGVFSAGGLIGREVQIPEGKHEFEYQYEIYCNTIPIQEYKAYKSSPVLQALLFSMLDSCLELDARTSIQLFRLITAVISACILGVFLLWVLDIFGLFSAFTTLLLIMLSPWITVAGGHVHWMFGIIYLPFLVPLVLLHREQKGKRLSPRLWFAGIASAVLLKCLFTGYELITTALVMMTMPVFLYAIWQRWNLRLFFRRFFSASIAGMLGVLISTVILSIQVAQVDGDMSKGFQHMQQRFLYRTNPDKAGMHKELSQEIKDTGNVPVTTIVKTYLDDRAISITTRYGYVSLSFVELLLIFAAVSALIFIRPKNRALTALAATTWISFLAPFSWFLIFRSHCVLHPHLTPLAWYMPMFLLLFTGIASLKKHLR